MHNAAHFASSLHAVAQRVGPLGSIQEDTRRAVCVGFWPRLFFTFSPQLEGRFALPVVGSPFRGMAAGAVSADEESSEDHKMQLRED